MAPLMQDSRSRVVPSYDDKVWIWNLMPAKPSEINGTEEIKVVVADNTYSRALMARPRLLMLDEPSLGLAPLIVREVLQVVASLRKGGVSVLLVEQNARAALQVADRGYVLEMGAVALTGQAQDLLHDRRIIDTYLGIGNKRDAQAPAAAA